MTGTRDRRQFIPDTFGSGFFVCVRSRSFSNVISFRNAVLECGAVEWSSSNPISTRRRRLVWNELLSDAGAAVGRYVCHVRLIFRGENGRCDMKEKIVPVGYQQSREFCSGCQWELIKVWSRELWCRYGWLENCFLFLCHLRMVLQFRFLDAGDDFFCVLRFSFGHFLSFLG